MSKRITHNLAKRITQIGMFFVLIIGNYSFAQRFVKLDSTTHLDRSKVIEWKNRYETIVRKDSSEFLVPYLSVREKSPLRIGFIWEEIPIAERAQMEFYINDVRLNVLNSSLASDTAILEIPSMEEDYPLVVQEKDGDVVAKLNVKALEYHSVEVIVVPLIKSTLSHKELSRYLNEVFGQAQLKMNVRIEPVFVHEDINSKRILDNPSKESDRYTDQMHEIRDAYFDRNTDANRDAYYVFIVPGFVNEKLKGYTVLNKSISFVKSDTTGFFRAIARQLGASVGALRSTWWDGGPAMGSTQNLMDEGKGTRLNQNQWEFIHRNCHSFSLYDDYEDVRTNGGLIAYYFWEEDKDGLIATKNGKLFSQLKLPFKRNYYSYYQNITNIFFKPLFKVFSFRINSMHFITLIVLILGIYFIRRKLFQRIKTCPRLVRLGANFAILCLFGFLAYKSFFLVNRGYRIFELKGGEVTEMKDASMREMRRAIENGIRPEILAEDHLGSELFVKKEGRWILKRRRNVLYFNQLTIEGKVYYKFIKDSDSLIVSTKKYVDKAESHYVVINYIDENRRISSQRVFNHLRVEITPKLTLSNPKKRILLFVNGYRPTSNGSSFEATFDSIRKKGLEHPNSMNLIYEYDRYNYWEPWNEINKRFQQRINPSETFYADGHFSVSTSNHRSLVDFTSLSQTYPDRCKNPKNHTCEETDDELTYKMFNLTSNNEGFVERRKNGRIAGRNLYQMLNEIPNKSKDDTLYIVAHSMGYAYSLGILDELRGKINFGGFYIIAPENAEAGQVRMNEWKEIWQYGSNFDDNKFKSPCLLDGIAPQTKAKGLMSANRVFIPDNQYEKKGFFDSHFIGYYTWIFDLSKGETGYIRQR